MNFDHLSRIDLNLLIVFQTVMEERHVGRAAARLHLTPSAVSHGLRRLRSTIGDPLFVKTSVGVEPTARALDLASRVADLLNNATGIFGLTAPFDPKESRRRFVIGGPDAALSSVAGPLIRRLQTEAPLVQLGFVHIMPTGREGGRRGPWSNAVEQIERRMIDVALLPLTPSEPQFDALPLYAEEFVVAMREGHAFARSPTLAAFCDADHLLVSISGEAFGFVDAMLAQRRLRRRIALTVPTFMMALPILASTNMLAALPLRLVEPNGARYKLTYRPLPMKRPPEVIQAVAMKHAAKDPGIAWLLARLSETAASRKQTSAAMTIRRKAAKPRPA